MHTAYIAHPAPRMAAALRCALMLLRDPDAEARDAELCRAVIVGALTEAGEMPQGAPR
jgi:hypothetical protein